MSEKERTTQFSIPAPKIDADGNPVSVNFSGSGPGEKKPGRFTQAINTFTEEPQNITIQPEPSARERSGRPGRLTQAINTFTEEPQNISIFPKASPADGQVISGQGQPVPPSAGGAVPPQNAAPAGQGAPVPPGGAPLGPNGMPQMPKPEMQTGMLRQDIELIRPGEHGNFAMLFDPGADAYCKISPRSLEIISRIDKSYPLTAFLEKLNACGLHADKDEVLQLISFLYQSNLIAPEYGQMEKKYTQYVKLREDTWFLR